MIRLETSKRAALVRGREEAEDERAGWRGGWMGGEGKWKTRLWRVISAARITRKFGCGKLR